MYLVFIIYMLLAPPLGEIRNFEINMHLSSFLTLPDSRCLLNLNKVDVRPLVLCAYYLATHLFQESWDEQPIYWTLCIHSPISYLGGNK